MKRIGQKLGLIALLSGVVGVGAVGVAFAEGNGGGGKRAELIQKYDTNGDGKLDDGERAQLKADMKAKWEAKKQEMLAKYDVNKDGKLDEQERATMKAEKAAERFKKLDTNGDGVLSQDEFAAGFHGHGGGFRHHHGGRR